MPPKRFDSGLSLGPRVSLGALVMEQGSDGEYTRQARSFADGQLQTDEAVKNVAFGLQLGAIAAATLGQFSSGDAFGGVGGLLLVSSSLVSGLGDSNPSAEEQIFSEIVALREQVEELRTEMHERFDLIDRRLNLIYAAMANGLNQINDTTRRIDGNVQQISIDLYELRSSLTRLEANLYGVLSAGFEQSFIQDMESGLDYRRRTGTDLEFAGPGENTFFAFHTRFYSQATSIASDEVYAGPNGRTLLNDASAVSTLSSFPLGYNINNLRELPADVGLSFLRFGRVANPTTWALAADAYAQLARENPWFFAKVHRNDPARLETMIGVGESVRDMMRTARSRALIDSLMNQYMPRAQALSGQIGLDGYLAREELPPGFDPFGGLAQDMRSTGRPFSELFRFGGGPSVEPVFSILPSSGSSSTRSSA